MAPEHRYAQFCPAARAAEILGERWTLLIARELLCGPQRFSDLRRRLPGIGSSILTERLSRLEERGLLARRDAPPPAPATLYELTPLGQTLRPVLLELMRFGARFIAPPRPGDHLEPDWLRLALEAFARRSATPSRRYAVRIPDGANDIEVHVAGGRRGTTVRDGGSPADVTLRAAPMLLLGFVGGGLDAEALLAAGQIEAEGDANALQDLPALFDLSEFLARPSPDETSEG